MQGVIIDVFANDESASLTYSTEGSTKYSWEEIKTILAKLQGVMNGSSLGPKWIAEIQITGTY